MASDIWLKTILIVRKETRCRHMAARVLLYAPSHRQDNTYHGLCYTSRGALAGTSEEGAVSIGIWSSNDISVCSSQLLKSRFVSDLLMTAFRVRLCAKLASLSGVSVNIQHHPFLGLIIVVVFCCFFTCKRSFICTDRITHTTAFATPVVRHWLEREIAQWVHHEGSMRTLLLQVNVTVNRGMCVY